MKPKYAHSRYVSVFRNRFLQYDMVGVDEWNDVVVVDVACAVLSFEVFSSLFLVVYNCSFPVHTFVSSPLHNTHTHTHT